MSLYSYISVDKSVNLPAPSELDFWGYNLHSFHYQTKDLGRDLETYHLKDGKLWAQIDEREWVEDGGIFGGYLETKSSEIKPYSHYTGEILFYHFLNDYDEFNDAWIEYKAKIVDGNIIEILLHEFKWQDNSDRKQWAQEMKEEAWREEELKKKWFRFAVYYYRGAKWYIGEGIYKVGSWISKIGNKLIWLGVGLK